MELESTIFIDQNAPLPVQIMTTAMQHETARLQQHLSRGERIAIHKFINSCVLAYAFAYQFDNFSPKLCCEDAENNPDNIENSP